MALRNFTSLAVLGALGLLTACPGDDGDSTTGTTGTTGSPTSATETDSTTGTPTTSTSETTGTTGTTDAPTGSTTGTADSELCTNFGGQAGVEAVIGSFIGKVLVNDKINAYFLSSDVDGANLGTCLSTQVGSAIGCAGVIYECGDMKTVHAGMGISTQDFNDLAADFVAAMNEVPTLTDADKATVGAALGSMLPDIVEDPDNNVSIYQRVGRKPAIIKLIGDPKAAESFVGLVAADATINTFFSASDFARLNTCLVRQVTGATAGGSALGPIYGKEVDAPAPADPGVGAGNPCLDMVTSHKDLKDDKMMGIEFADFGALVGHLVTAMTTAGVTMDDQNAIAGVLGPLCPDIVTVDPENCP